MDVAAATNIDEILRTLEDGIRDFMQSDKYKTYLKAVGRFHDYSVNNILLISMQKPNATLVAGYTTWKNGFKRYVKKGEKGIRIIAPAPVKVEKERDVLDQYGNASREKVLVTVPRFKAVTVFDVSQTDGEPLPTIDPSMLDASVEDYGTFLIALKKSSRVPVNYVEIKGGAKGYYEAAKDEIFIQKGMSQAQTVKTLVHEMAHSYLHSRSRGGALIPSSTKEVEAESVAFAVCSYFGIDTSEYTFPYVSGWSGDKDLKTLRDSLDTIRDTSSMLIHEIDDNYSKIKRDIAVSELAAEFSEFAKEHDPVVYSIAPEDEDTRLESIRIQLRDGRVQSVLSTLREYRRDVSDPAEKQKISDLMDRIESFRPDVSVKEQERKDRER